jgi:hypothetical protein
LRQSGNLWASLRRKPAVQTVKSAILGIACKLSLAQIALEWDILGHCPIVVGLPTDILVSQRADRNP